MVGLVYFMIVVELSMIVVSNGSGSRDNFVLVMVRIIHLMVVVMIIISW